jgi:TPR repeat protein
MYYGNSIKAIGHSYTRGTKILMDVQAEIETLAEKGIAMAQYFRGVIARAHGDYATALKWFSKSAIHYLPAIHELGALYDVGYDGGRTAPYSS